MAGVEWQSLRDEFTSAAALADDQSHLLSGKSRWGDYLHCYWRYFHPLFPILHYAATISAPPPALALLMVMIGAQFSALPESKIHSIAMHDSCAKLFEIVSLSMKNEGEFGAHTCNQQSPVTAWSCLSDMQTVLLLEVFHRYRAREARLESIPLSSQFRVLYSSVSDGLDDLVLGSYLLTA